MSKKIAVLLAGCGCFDGSEIHEAVLTLLAIEQHHACYQCFSIDELQYQVVDHGTRLADNQQSRNMLSESARIARGEVKELTRLKVAEYDGLIIPGGYGVAHNLCDFAIQGQDFAVRADIAQICLDFTLAAKPVGFLCIAPIMIAKIYSQLCAQQGAGIRLTLGQDRKMAEIVNGLGMQHVDTAVDDICIDSRYKIVTTPAYMLAQGPAAVYEGVYKLVTAMLKMMI